MKRKSTLYIDESGKSSLADTGTDAFLIVGTILDDDELHAVEGYFAYIKRKYGIEVESPFHSYDIYENPKSKLTPNQLQQLSISLADFISTIPIQIQILEISKSTFSTALGVTTIEDFKGSSKRKEVKDFPYRVMASSLFASFAKYLENNKMIGQIIADSRRGSDHQLIKTLNLCKEGHVPYKDSNLSSIISSRVTAICFAEKHFLSGGLEITDLISYTAYLRARRMLTDFKSTQIEKIWEVIRSSAEITKIEEVDVKRFFGLKENEVHKYLKT